MLYNRNRPPTMTTLTDDKSGTLISVIQIFRHGQRTPISPSYPNDPFKEDAYGHIGMDELTKKGKREVYELGQYTRQRYKKFLPSFYSKNDFRVYNNRTERSISSAQLFATGLYPPTEEDIWDENIKWNPIPTRLAEPAVLSVYPKSICPRYAKLHDVVIDELYKEFKRQPFSHEILSNAGFREEKTYTTIGYMHDCLKIQKSLGLKIPEWAEKNLPFMDCHLQCLRSFTETDELKTLYVGPFLYELVQHFNKMAKNPLSGPKLIAYSGHDCTIIAFLRTLIEEMEPHYPAHASALYFELRNNNGEYYISIFYRNEGKTIPLEIKGVGYDCKLNQFEELFSQYIITVEEFYEKCSS